MACMGDRRRACGVSWGDLIEFTRKTITNEIGWQCGKYGGQETCMRCFVGRPDRIHLEDEGTDGRIILKWIFKQWDEEA